jgi:hypothetical protein
MKSPKKCSGTSAFRGENGASAGLAGKLLFSMVIMTPLHPSGHLAKSEAAVHPHSKHRAKTPKRRPKVRPTVDGEVVRPAVGTLSRTKSLLLAALKVWELKNGIRD